MEAWPVLDPDQEPDIGDPGLAALAMDEPLGAFYRVNAFQLDDMQSAVNELHAIVVSAQVHEGWRKPTVLKRKSATGATEHLTVIERTPSAEPLGGHAHEAVDVARSHFDFESRQRLRVRLALLDASDWHDPQFRWMTRRAR